jgi:hypothetical protein
MRQYCFPLIVGLSVIAAASTARATGQNSDTIVTTLASHQYDMENEGRSFLLQEAENSQFFLLGELHGDKEIPTLLRVLWPAMWAQGYRHIAAEVSPWAAHQLESVPTGKRPTIQGLWTSQEVADLHAVGTPGANIIWGCDMEEQQPQLLIRELAALNPADADLKHMAQITKNGYSRKMAPELLDLAKKSKARADEVLNDVSLRDNLVATLEIEKSRLDQKTRMVAQDERERLMKEQFIAHFRHQSTAGATSRVLLRFGRNHLHRGYNARGISTLGNFVAEFAVAQGTRIFNVGAFGAGGEAKLLGSSWNADERKDELAFALLAEKAKYPATLFDLRPIRQLLHRIPPEKRSALESNLVYWADSYDALICYKTVTPLDDK